MMNQPWVEKYAPQKIQDLIGNSAVISKVSDWVANWPRSIVRNRRALILHGPPGVGKTVAVYTIARELGFEVSEINATVKRSKKMMNELLKNTTMMTTLTQKKGRLVLVDELAGLSGRSDRGAASALKDYIPTTRVPMVLVTTDISDSKIRPLLQLCTNFEFEPLITSEITELLTRICQQEKLEFEESALQTLATFSRGDLRAAINDLQSVRKTRQVITNASVIEFLKKRDRIIDLNETLNQIFYADSWNQAIFAANQTDVYPDELIRWVSNNVPLVFRDLKQQVKAFELLSKASIFSRRIQRTQNWRLLPYSKELMCITGSLTQGIPTPTPPKYQFPEWIRQMGFSRSKRQKRLLIGQLLSPTVHLSARKAYQEYLLILKSLLENTATKDTVTADLELSDELVQFILKD
ncbi:MAG: replication factor C large subunit [Candidatus Hermodarchaeota archaeon]|nr:replication factor C large subunit [Candidatus Hermodarchaeota archaeon]